ncbi:MAG TPA: sn-glycerol-1-phosphate dehydrogenase, partial [Armatimonadota bacterium]|nr:sn-glycerol-1-phosphate dehydrogenase [Armatimonadota bacterium]
RADRLRSLAQIWDEMRARLRADLPTVPEHRQRLEAAGAPTAPEQVGQSPESARAAVRYGRYLRARYTVLDLAADLAVLED